MEGASELDRLIASAKLLDVKYYGISARAREKEEDLEVAPLGRGEELASAEEGDLGGAEKNRTHVTWDVSIGLSERRVIVRADCAADRQDAIFSVDAAAEFDTSEFGSEPSKESLLGFVQHEGLPTLFPFIRQALVDSAQRLRLPNPVPGFSIPYELIDKIGKAEPEA